MQIVISAVKTRRHCNVMVLYDLSPQEEELSAARIYRKSTSGRGNISVR